MKHYLLGALLAAVVAAPVPYALYRTPGTPVPDHPFVAGEQPLVIAHRGGRGLWPENTLAAFRASAELGVDVLEMDVRRTASGDLVVIHDRDVARTTDGVGAVADLSTNALQALDAGYHFSPDGGRSFPYRGRGVVIPRLREVFAALGPRRMLVELKDRLPATGPQLCREIRAHGLGERVLAASFHTATLAAFRRACPEVATAAGPGEAWSLYLASATRLLGLAQPRGQVLAMFEDLGPLRLISPRLVAHAQQLNVRVHVWTVNREEDIRRVLAAGVSGLMSDYPDRVLAVLAERAQPHGADRPGAVAQRP